MGSLFKPKQVGPTQADVTAAATPWGLTGPAGGVTFDPETKLGTATLSPEMQALADRLLGRAETQAEAISAFDPQTQAQQYYQQYVAPDLMEAQQQERLGAESRLLSQGRLGTSGGAGQFGDLLRAQAASRRGARGEAFQQSQQLMDAMRQREMADIAQAGTLYQSPTGLFGTGANIGQGIGGILGQYRPQYQQAPGMALLGLGTSLASGGAFGAGGAATGFMQNKGWIS